MVDSRILLALTSLVLLSAAPASAANSVRISKVYGGNGQYYSGDLVELFNNSAVAVSIGGWTLQYGSATTATGFSTASNSVAQLPAGAMIPACGYYLIHLAASATGNPPPISAPDALFPSVNISATSGKLVLRGAAPAVLPCLGNILPVPAGSPIVDEVGYGTGAGLCFETAAAPVSNANAVLVRASGGAQDTDDNSADFTVVPAPVQFWTTASGSNRNPACVVVPAARSSWGSVKIRYR